MTSYTVFIKTVGEAKANIIGSSLERMSPKPVGVGVFEIEDGCGLWEISGFFVEKPNALDIKILEVTYQTEFVVSQIFDKDWISHVQRDLRPVRAGRFLLYGQHDRENVSINDYGLQIEAAMAFGTGHHATTVGCLLALEQLKKSGYVFQNVVDIGCGTGVLAMATARIYRADLIAVDIDAVAVETAKVNFRANGLDGKITLVQSRGFNRLEIIKRAPFDLVFANILAKPLCLLAYNMAKYTKKKGFIILSGILNSQVTGVEKYYIYNGFFRVSTRRVGEWTTIIMRRN